MFARSLLPWAAISLGAGIALYFSLNFEPPPELLLAATLLAAAAGLGALRAYKLRRSLTFALSLLAVFALLGFCRAGWQTRLAAAPVLQKPLYSAAFTAKIAAIEPRLDSLRLTLDEVVFVGLTAAETPKRVRINIRGDPVGEDYRVGARIGGRGGFYPPARPRAPGLVDLARLSWFKQIGAYGYSLGAPRIVAPGEERLGFNELRRHAYHRIQGLHPTPAGAIAAALMVGMRGNIPPQITENIRISGLAHLLAISGLHLGLVMGGVFFFTRALLAAAPRLALKYNIKKWAVYPSLAVGVFYLLLTGSTIPTIRALLMASLVLAAVLLERTAISTRLLAIAAIGVLSWSPQALIQPGFQMSFAATAALIWFYHLWRRATGGQRHNALRKAWLYFLALGGASFVAWAASSPFAVYHFHRLAVYALPSNLAAVPITAFWVMPAGIIALALMPMGADAPFLGLMTAGIDIIIQTAELMASLPHSVWRLPIMPNFTLLALTAALIALFLAATKRGAAFAALAAAAGIWLYAGRQPPDVVVGLDAVAFRDGDTWFTDRFGRKRGGRWEAILLPQASDRPPPSLGCDPLGCVHARRGRRIAISKDNMGLGRDCATADILLIPHAPLKVRCPKPVLVIDRFDLWRDGTHTITLEPFLEINNVGAQQGDRPWRRKSP